MKKTILVFGLLACLVMFVGCASTRAVASVDEENKIVVPKIGKKLCGDNDENPLTKTSVTGVYVIHPHQNFKWTIENGCQYEIEITEKKSGNVYTIENVVTHWNGMSGWYGQVVTEDLTFITTDYIQYVVKANLFTWNILMDERYAVDSMDNTIVETEVPSIYVLKPGYYKNIKQFIENGEIYTIQVIDKSTGDVVKTFDNVVTDWQGMSGWNGKVLKEDYTFITQDVKQYVVKARKYSIKVIK